MTKDLYKYVVMKLLGKMDIGHLTVTDEHGQEHVFGGSGMPEAKMTITNSDFYRQVVLYGDVGFGEAYMQGMWESAGVTKVVSFLIANMAHLPATSGTYRLFSPINMLKMINKMGQMMKPNSLRGARRNIASHYDLNNTFFSLFLDPTMTYSCGLFRKDGDTLEQAQINKYERLCEESRVGEEDHILEIGCGWGGFARYAASNFGSRITGVTISTQQYELARSRAERAGLTDKIEFLFRDYRKLSGKFDRVISIEMIEAVGHRYLKAYFRKIAEMLKPEGILGLQAIVIPDSRYDQYRKSVDWLQKHIFPGGLLPSIARINNAAGEAGKMNLYGLKEMGLSYAKTLRSWHYNFKQNADQIMQLGFDEVFMRKWEYYLCSCEASFLQRNINVVQMVYARPGNPLI